MFITDFNSEYKKYIDYKKLSKSEKKLKIKQYEKNIEEKQKENYFYRSQKSSITKRVKSGKMNYITASKEYDLASAKQYFNKIRIKEYKEYIKAINNDKDQRIEIKGIFCRFFVKKSYLIKLQNPASYILKKDLAEVNEIINTPSYEIENSDKKRNGIESQKERLELNLSSVESGEKNNSYPIEVLISPLKIVLL